MTTYRLEELCEFITDGTHQTPEYCETGGFIFLSSKDVTNRRIDWDHAKRIPTHLHHKLYERLKPRINDILLAKNGTTGIAALVDRDEVFDVYVSLAVLRPKKTVYPPYLLYAINSSASKRQFNDGLKGIGVQNLHLNIIRKTQIKLPLLDDQVRICKSLDQITYLITSRKRQIELLDELIKARFVETFGDPVKNKMGWEESLLYDKIEIIGGYAFKSHGFDNHNGIPVIRIGNINTGCFKSTNMVFWQEDNSLKRYIVYPGDLVISLTGTVGKDDYGNVCIIGNEYEKYYLNQRNAKLEIKTSINKYYLLHFFRFDIIKKQLTGINRGVRQANISNKDILSLKIPIPPSDLQNQFASFVAQVEHVKSCVQASTSALEMLFDSMMQTYFG